jgi:putative nucleotidyltransferase with HDIG domain
MPLISLHLSREESLKNIEKLPKLSPMLMHFVALAAKPGIDVDELAEVVERDTVLSAQILQRANSAWFGRSNHIRTIHHAIAMLGIGTIRRFALGSSITNLFAREKIAKDFSISRFNLHSVATGTLAEILAEELAIENREAAFVAGLLHDIGKLLIATHMRDRYEDVLAAAAIGGGTVIEFEQSFLGTDHAELSALAISRWELGDAMRIAARYHHDPATGTAEERLRPGKIGLTAVVARANAFVNYLGMSVLPAIAPQAERPSLEFPGTRLRPAVVRDKFQAEWKNLWSLLR